MALARSNNVEQFGVTFHGGIACRISIAGSLKAVIWLKPDRVSNPTAFKVRTSCCDRGRFPWRSPRICRGRNGVDQRRLEGLLGRPFDQVHNRHFKGLVRDF
jgi:hypothetical protein